MSPSQAIVASIHRYPVKSMMGEELNSVAVTKRGGAGDRAYWLIDVETNKLVNAKHPQKWPEMFAYRARYTAPPVSHVPPVHITLPNGDVIESTSGDAEQTLSAALHKPVRLVRPDGSDKGFEGLCAYFRGGLRPRLRFRQDLSAWNVFRHRSDTYSDNVDHRRPAENSAGQSDRKPSLSS
jgi:hypothetical protein